MQKFQPVTSEVDAALHFLLITGVSKFAKVSLFSELNNLRDLTNTTETAAIVGYTTGHYYGKQGILLLYQVTMQASMTIQ